MLLVKFYNLHLQDGRLSNAEKEKLIEFLKIHAPTTVENNRFLSLGWYEYETGISWFESEHFSDFVNEYCRVKEIVDGYLSNKLSVTSLQWLKERLEQWKPTLRIVDFAGKHYSPRRWEGDIDLTQCKITTKAYSYTVSHDIRELPHYGIAIDFLLTDIYWQLALLLEKRKDIRRCAAKATAKTPACQNIFVPQRKGALYCSTRCKNRIHQAKLNAERKEALAGIHKRRRKNVYKP